MDFGLKAAEKIGGIINRISEKTGLDKKQLAVVVLFISGLVLLVVSGFSDADKKNFETVQTSAYEVSADTYVSELEERITSIISSIDGAGATQVMITLENSGEDVYLHNYDYGEDVDGEGGGNREMKDEYVIVDSGDGENGIVVRKTEPKIRGVAVVCEGGGNESVKVQIIATVTALLDISSARVSVVKMSE